MFFRQLLYSHSAKLDFIRGFVAFQKGKHRLWEFDLLQGNKLQALLGTNVNAAAAKDALGAIDFSAFKDRVDPAAEATLRFLGGRLFI